MRFHKQLKQYAKTNFQKSKKTKLPLTNVKYWILDKTSNNAFKNCYLLYCFHGHVMQKYILTYQKEQKPNCRLFFWLLFLVKKKILFFFHEILWRFEKKNSGIESCEYLNVSMDSAILTPINIFSWTLSILSQTKITHNAGDIKHKKYNFLNSP